MFGIRNKIEKQINEAFAQIKEQRNEFGEKVNALEERRGQIYADLEQAERNTKHIIESASQNVQEEVEVMQALELLSVKEKETAEAYHQFLEEIKEQHAAITSLVEENKHFTTPSKYVTEAPAKIRNGYRSYEEKLSACTEKSKKMSVLALHAAIEAGRLGEAGKPFVEASEEIRKAALEYETSISAMQEELQAAQSSIDELEEFVFRLVSLIKESSVATSKIRKQSAEILSRGVDCSKHDFAEDFASIRAKVVSMRNLDEEIVKASERNKIQLSDIRQDMEEQKKDLQELESDLDDLFDEERFMQRLH